MLIGKKATEKFDARLFNTRHDFDVALSQKKSRTEYELHMFGVTFQGKFFKLMTIRKNVSYN